MRVLAIAVLATGCATAYQSARTIPKGKTQVAVGLTRAEIVRIDDDTEDTAWIGELQVRHGLADRIDGGLRLARIPGAGTTVSQLGIDPKFQLTGAAAQTTLSFAVPVSVTWSEDGIDATDALIAFAPSLFIGIELSPMVELVVSPKVFVILPDGDTAQSELELGGSIGLRLSAPSRSWAVHPEIGLFRVTDEDGGGSTESETFMMIGLGIWAGT